MNQAYRGCSRGTSTPRALPPLHTCASGGQEAAELESAYSNASIQGQRYLRDANGKIVKGPLTGEARRIDFAVIENGQAKKLVETTSMTANKKAQIAKENRIREAGGTYIRDKNTKKLIDVSNVKTEVVRRQ